MNCKIKIGETEIKGVGSFEIEGIIDAVNQTPLPENWKDSLGVGDPISFTGTFEKAHCEELVLRIIGPSVNPDNQKQARLFYDLREANDRGENRHPQIVMRELAGKHGFTILDSVPQSLFDGWDYWIESDNLMDLHLPKFFRENVPWKAIGEA
jgi:hypothetical protein